MKHHELLLDTLKKYMKHKGITYSKLSKTLGQSEANVKRIFSTRSLSVERLDQICEAVGIDLFQLAKMSVPNKEDDNNCFNLEQEEALAADPKLFALFFLLLAGISLKKILATYSISETEARKRLFRLDKLSLIQLLPLDEIKILVSKNIRWIPDGPLNTLYETDIKNEFMASPFTGANERLRFLNGNLTEQSIKRLDTRINRLVAEFVESAEMDQTNPPGDSQQIWFVIAYRPWRFSAVTKLKKQ